MKQGMSDSSEATDEQIHLRPWLHPAILSAAAFAAAAGFAQFGVSAALGDVAAEFGEPQPDLGVSAGLAGTTLGLGLAVIRLASLGALPLAALADHAGRKKVLLVCTAIGLSFTVLASLSPSFWVFVAIFALGRPLLSAANGLAGVIAAEETTAADRSKALAVISAAYGVGAGMTAMIRGAVGDGLSFRVLFALTIVPLILLPLLARKLEEPERFSFVQRKGLLSRHLFSTIPHSLRSRLYIMCVLWAAIGFVSGPANMFLFYFGESVQGLTPLVMALTVAGAGPTGLIGLLVGRWAADAIGRRLTSAVSLCGVALSAVITYNGGQAGVVVGYLLAVLVASAYAPAAGALSVELFPTSIRATVAGWLTAVGVLGAVAGLFLFGGLVDFFDDFGAASAAIALPVALVSFLYLKLPETKGLELEESAPDLSPDEA